MRKLIVTEFMSLDGVFEAPGPDGSGYKYEGWTFDYGDDEFQSFKVTELDTTDILLLGRVTYDDFAKAWPKIESNSFSDKFKSMPKYVVSNTLKKAEWNNSRIIKENPIVEIKKLKEGNGGDITVHGSGMLARFLLDSKLVDQVNILLYPVILGSGKQLFKEAQKQTLKLIESKAFRTGVIALKYIPERP